MEKIKPIIVLAGNYRQFREATLGHRKGFVFGDSIEKMAGVEAQSIIVVGTFWNRKDASILFEKSRTRIR